MTQPSDRQHAVLSGLKQIMSFYGIHTDLDAALSTVAQPLESPGPDSLEVLAKKAGLQTIKTRATSQDLLAHDLPALCIAADHTVAVWLPGGEQEDIDFLKYDYALLFKVKKDDGLETAHMVRGHALDWFWTPLKTCASEFRDILICSLFINLLVLAMPLYTMNIYDIVVINFSKSTLFALTFGIVIALVFDNFFKLLRIYILERVATRTAAVFDTELMARFLHMKPGASALTTGEKANIFRELQGVKDFYATKLAPTLIDLPFFLIFCLVIYLISPPLALVPIIGALVILAANFSVRMSVNRVTRDYFTSMQSKSATLIETLQGIDCFRMLNATGYVLYRWKHTTTESVEAARRNHLSVSAVSGFSMTVTQFVQVFILVVGVYQISAEALTIGGLIAATIISGRAIAPIVGLAGTLATLQQTRDVLVTIDKIFTLPNEENEPLQPHHKESLTGRIKVEDASFAYANEGRPALYRLNFDIKAGEKIGLIGRTGAGKTTLGKLLAGQYAPVQGALYLDGVNYDALAPAARRRAVGYVPQEPFFFRGTIRENILVGLPEVTGDVLDQALHVSGLDIVLEQTGYGLDHDVGEHGGKLSGGQRQAISLARAIVREPTVLIFDEPTTGMDNALEARVRSTLSDFIKNRTFIMITHRTSILSLVDRLLLLEQGQIAGDGPRSDIMKKLGGG